MPDDSTRDDKGAIAAVKKWTSAPALDPMAGAASFAV
jgi:hypothetical protein